MNSDLKCLKNVSKGFFLTLLLGAAIYTIDACAQQASPVEMQIGFWVGTKPSGSFSTTGSPLFTGTTTSDTPAKLSLQVRATEQYKYIPTGLGAEVFVGSGDTTHELFFTGTSLGKQTCGGALGIVAKYWFVPKSYAVQPYIGVGLQNRDCSGSYGIGGTPFSPQTTMSGNSSVIKAGLSVDVAQAINNPQFKGLYINAEVEKVKSLSSSVTPVAGNSLSWNTGGTTGQVGISYSLEALGDLAKKLPRAQGQ